MTTSGDENKKKEDWKPLVGFKGYFEIDQMVEIVNDKKAMEEINKVIMEYLRKTDHKLFIVSSKGKPTGYFEKLWNDEKRGEI